jgi:2-polyprenyl-3-methyl-5-hydroxy-6-metoxy-1,4-benzoquinol methylase
MALTLTKDYFHKANAIDFGCADGVFLPSLSKHFDYVCAIDRNPKFLEIASTSVSRLGLTNVDLLCNDGLTIHDLKKRLSDREYKVLYLLETLEHIGERESPYDSRIRFLEEMAALTSKDGIIVVSVPNMVGIFFLIQRIGLALTGSLREPISLMNLLKASFLRDTSELEKQWNGGHLGFNHTRLERRMRDRFNVIRRRHLAFQVIYCLKR